MTKQTKIFYLFLSISFVFIGIGIFALVYNWNYRLDPRIYPVKYFYWDGYEKKIVIEKRSLKLKNHEFKCEKLLLDYQLGPTNVFLKNIFFKELQISAIYIKDKILYMDLGKELVVNFDKEEEKIFIDSLIKTLKINSHYIEPINKLKISITGFPIKYIKGNYYFDRFFKINERL